jgi:hypothetical protein
MASSKNELTGGDSVSGAEELASDRTGGADAEMPMDQSEEGGNGQSLEAENNAMGERGGCGEFV